MWIYKNTVVLFITMQLKNKTFTIYPYTSTQYTPVILAAVIWLKYCRYGVKLYSINYFSRITAAVLFLPYAGF